MNGLRGGLMFVMFVFLVSSVFALGVSPGKSTLSFNPNVEELVNFEVINSGNKDVNLLLSVQGELAEYVSLSVEEVFMSAGERSRTLSYGVNLPEDLAPGLHIAEVFIFEIPEISDDSGSSVLASLAVVTQIHVNVPYPGRFAEADLVVYDANQGEDVNFVFPVISRGSFDLVNVRANVDVFNSLGEKIDSFNTQSISVPSGERKQLVYAWKADVPIGVYRAAASLIYDEGVLSFEAVFNVGLKSLELQEISVNIFSLGDIVKLEMLVENKWSEEIVDAYIATRIRDSNGDIVSSFDSTVYDIGALSKRVFVSYWDTVGIRVGNYDAEISLNYGENRLRRNLEFQVSENDLVIIGLGRVISAEEGGGSNTLIIVLIVVIVILVLVNLLWFLLLRKRFRR